MDNALPQHTNSKLLVWCTLHISYCGITLSEAQWTDNDASARLQCDIYFLCFRKKNQNPSDHRKKS